MVPVSEASRLDGEEGEEMQTAVLPAVTDCVATAIGLWRIPLGVVSTGPARGEPRGKAGDAG